MTGERAALRLRVAGLTLAAFGPRATRVLEPVASYRAFLASRGADIRLDLSDEPIPTPRGEPLFESGGVWRVHRHGRGLLYSFRAPKVGTYKAVSIDRGIRRGILHFPRTPDAPRYALDFPLDELLFQHRWAGTGRLEVHSCGVVERGRTLLFCGQSGAGKSTTAGLWHRHRPQAHTLSDDRVVLHPGRVVRAFGTPWHGDGGFASPRSAPLAALFFLVHARRTTLRPLAPAEAAGRLFTRTFPPMWDRRAVTATLDACARVATRVPAYELRFRPDASAVEAVLEAMSRP